MIKICVTLNEGHGQYNYPCEAFSCLKAVIVPSLMMMTLIISKESLARDRQTDRQTVTHTHAHTHTEVVKLKCSKSQQKQQNTTFTSVDLSNTPVTSQMIYRPVTIMKTSVKLKMYFAQYSRGGSGRLADHYHCISIIMQSLKDTATTTVLVLLVLILIVIISTHNNYIVSIFFHRQKEKWPRTDKTNTHHHIHF